jgi:hypothetical protein
MQLIIDNAAPLPRLNTSYSEAAYFDGNHCQHVVAREEHLRLQRIRTNAIKALDRRSVRR